MGNWGFWDWVGYVSLFVAALIVAVGQAMKESEELRAQFAVLLKSRPWNYLPLGLMILSLGIFVIKQIGSQLPLLNENNSAETIVGEQEIPASSEVSVYKLPADLSVLSNEELRLAAYTMSTMVEDFTSASARVALDIESNKSLSPEEKAVFWRKRHKPFEGA